MIENKETIKLNIGTNVSSKKTGYPGVGMVVGIMHPQLYAAYGQKSIVEMIEQNKTWLDLYPEWFKHEVVIVYYKEPRRTITLEESKKYNISHEEWDNYPKCQFISYCIEDLEVFDEE
jgi:hypothetical protein